MLGHLVLKLSMLVLVAVANVNACGLHHAVRKENNMWKNVLMVLGSTLTLMACSPEVPVWVVTEAEKNCESHGGMLSIDTRGQWSAICIDGKFAWITRPK